MIAAVMLHNELEPENRYTSASTSEPGIVTPEPMISAEFSEENSKPEADTAGTSTPLPDSPQRIVASRCNCYAHPHRFERQCFVANKLLQKAGHALLHWTACYIDDCIVHMDGKDGASYWPKKPQPQQYPAWDDRNNYHFRQSFQDCIDNYCLSHMESKVNKLGFQPPLDFEEIQEQRDIEKDKLLNPKKYDPEYELVLDSKATEEEGGPVLTYAKKIDCSREIQTISATRYGQHFVKKILINGVTANIMIDSEATGNFITPQFIARAKISTQQKLTPVQINTIDGKPFDEGTLGEETTPVPMNFEHHLEMIQFDTAKIARYDAILGMPWLEEHNPNIDWATQDIDFPRCRCNWDPRGKVALPAPYYYREVWEEQLEQGNSPSENATTSTSPTKN